MHLAGEAARFSQIAGDRPGFDYRGPNDNGGLAMILPVALAYYNQPLHVRDEAIKEALSFSHPLPSAVDAGGVFTAAIVFLMNQPSPETDSEFLRLWRILDQNQVDIVSG